MRREFSAVLKVVVVAAVVSYVLASGKINFGDVSSLLVAPGFFLCALGVLTVQTLVTALRLRALLRAHGDTFSIWTVVKLTYIGAAFDLIATTSVGGDAVKAFYLAQEIPAGRRTESVSALFVDRLLGLLGMFTLTAAAALWSLNTLWLDAAVRPYLRVLAVVCGALLTGSFLLFSRRIQDWAPLRWLLGKLPFGNTLNRAYSSMRAFRDQPVILLEGWLLSVLVHVLGCFAGFLLATGLGMHVSETSGQPGMASQPGLGESSLFFVALLMSNFISSFAPFGGIGVGQLAYPLVFQHVARMEGGANLATLIQLAFIVVKAPGLIFWIMMKRTEKPGAPATVNPPPAAAETPHPAPPILPR